MLVVVDDADLRDDLGALLLAAHRPVSPQTVRVLLVAREFTDWWTDAQQLLPMAVDTAAGRTRLGPIAADVSGQRVVAKHALAAFSERLGTHTPGTTLTGITATTPVVMLHAAALEAVLQAVDGRNGPVDVTDAVDRLMTRERQRWSDYASEQGLDNYPDVTADTLRDVLVFTMLAGTRTREDTHRLLPLLPGLRKATPQLLDRVIVWLHLYPRVVGYWARPHLPTVLAEHLIADALADNTDLAAAVCLAASTPEHASAVVTTLARAATHTASARMAITTLLGVDPDRLIPIAICIALHGHGPIDIEIADTIRTTERDWDALQSLKQLLPGRTNVLNYTQIAVAQARAAHAPTTLATELVTLVEALAQGSQHGEAVIAATEAVTTSRRLADAEPAHQSYLAHALDTLATLLSHEGRYREAVISATEAITIYRLLADADPTTHQHNLAHALDSFAGALRQAGRHGDALIAATEAVTIQRTLADVNSAAYGRCLAQALDTLANAHRRVGHNEEALIAAAEAVTTSRLLADAEPGAYQYYLAQALHTLADVLLELERYGEAVVAATEAVTIHRLLSNADIVPYRHFLARELTSLANALSHVGRHGEAVIAATEAVTICRLLADAHPAAYQTYLARALGTLADALWRGGQYGEAVIAVTESVTIYRLLADADPATHQPQLARALDTLAYVLGHVGQHGGAVIAVTKAVTTYRRLEDANPDAYQHYLAHALGTLAKALRRVGDNSAAVTAVTEAVTIHRLLADANPDVYQRCLAEALTDLANAQRQLGQGPTIS